MAWSSTRTTRIGVGRAHEGTPGPSGRCTSTCQSPSRVGPASAARRTRLPARGSPSPRAPGGTVRSAWLRPPSSPSGFVTRILSSSADRTNSTRAVSALPCLSAFVRASWTIRYAAWSTAWGRSRPPIPVRVTLTVRPVRCSSSDRSSSCARPGAAPRGAVGPSRKRHQHPPEVVDRGSAGDLDALERCRGFVRPRLEHSSGCRGLDPDDRHLTGDGIVKLARESKPLLEQRPLAIARRAGGVDDRPTPWRRRTAARVRASAPADVGQAPLPERDQQ